MQRPMICRYLELSMMQKGQAVVNSLLMRSVRGSLWIVQLQLIMSFTPILKHKPWWQVFLVTHRNIYREQNALICSSSPSKLLDASPPLNVAGYSFDADCYNGAPLFSSSVRQPESVASEPTIKSGLWNMWRNLCFYIVANDLLSSSHHKLHTSLLTLFLCIILITDCNWEWAYFVCLLLEGFWSRFGVQGSSSSSLFLLTSLLLQTPLSWPCMLF